MEKETTYKIRLSECYEQFQTGNGECDSPETVRQLIALGPGVSFVPAITWKGTGSDKMVLRPLSYPTARRYMYISSYENAYLSRAARLFRNYIIKYFSSLEKEAGL